MKIELTIDTNYVSSWGVVQGLREILQNAKDAEEQFSAPMKVSHYNKKSLRVENEGCVLPLKALLLGGTSKAGTNLRGIHGEGLKLACLALVRDGYGVKIRNGSQVWVPSIEYSTKFHTQVLVFDIQEGRKEENRVRFEIEGVDSEAWEQIKKLFLFLSPDNERSIKTLSGSLLTHPDHKGKIYVKGIFVHNDPKLDYGYDFLDAQLDRDRKILDYYDKQTRIRCIWEEALKTRPDLLEPFYTLLVNEKADSDGYEDWNVYSIPTQAAEFVAAKFKEQHGEKAVPVRTLEQSKDLEHLGVNGVITPKPLAAVLQKVIGSVDTVRENMRQEVVKTYSWSELEEGEKNNLEEAIELVNKATSTSLSDIDVVDFRSNTLQGQFKNGRFLLAKKDLNNFDELLTTLVHEVAHLSGLDGEKGHVASIERIWSKIVSFLRSSSKSDKTIH